MKKNPFLNDESGETNFVSIIIIIALIIIFCLIFGPELKELVQKLLSQLFS